MQVKVIDYGFKEEIELNYVRYRVSGLDKKSLEKVYTSLEEEMEIDSQDLIITLYFPPEYYPFGSNEAQLRLQDFISREEIEMTVFLSSILEENL